MITVGIVIILAAVAFIAIFEIQKNLRQKELDSKAEIIYEAAQNQLSKMKASGDVKKYSQYNSDGSKKADVQNVGIVPLDSDNEKLKEQLYYVISDTNSKSEYLNGTSKGTAELILPEDVIDEELWGHYWVIEYNPSSGSVYAVFYSEDENWATYTPSNWNEYRGDSDNRKTKTKARVGYYGGDALFVVPIDRLKPTISVENGEELIATFSCDRSSDLSTLSFIITITDDVGNEKEIELSHEDIIQQGLSVGYKYTYKLVLDSLKLKDGKTSQRFCDLFPELIAGTNIEIKLKVVSSSLRVADKTTSVKTNSLFAYEKDAATSQAIITCGRHLQNLDEKSGVNATEPKSKTSSSKSRKTDNVIKTAIQKSDITFYDVLKDEKDWYSIYGTRKFDTIVNSKLTSYSGSYSKLENGEVKDYFTTIYGLNIAESADGNAALFDTISTGTEDTPAKLSNIILTGVVASGTSRAATLIGKVSGHVDVKDCWTYLAENKGEVKDVDDKRIDAPVCAGLIGEVVENATASIDNSFASTIIGEAGATVGGLVGINKGTLSIENSYADCYLYGKTVGGLVGNSTGTIRNIESCYAVGYISAETGGKSAGIANGTVNTIKNSYSAVDYNQLDNKAELYTTVTSANTVSKTFYSGDGQKGSSIINLNGTTPYNFEYMSSQGFLTELGGNFVLSGVVSNPYNLLGQGLTDYSYPSITNLPHYGDWQAHFVNGKLAYFEKYENGLYGFFGANIDALDKTGVVAVGDGFGIVYNANPLNSIHIATASEEYDINPNDASCVKYTLEYEGVTYYILPIHTSTSNPSAVQDQFMQLIKINGVEYYFNPHFAKTVSNSNVVPTTIEINTARQLNNLSLYYKEYRNVTSKCSFVQNRDINYVYYEWTTFATSGVVDKQEPIGGSEDDAFISEFDGKCHTITGVSFVTQRDDFVGMFGVNEGKVSNVVLTTDYDTSKDKTTADLRVSRTAQIGAQDTVYMGVLAGKNTGEISNCAVAGYYVAGGEGTIYSLSDSHLYIGGLVGKNEGAIYNSSSDSPKVSISTSYTAETRLGGFVGYNTDSGTINNCYCLGSLEVTSAKEGNTILSGFAAYNDGFITECYCATSMIGRGDNTLTYGFSPLGGHIENVQYLNGGTFRYVGTLYSYSNKDGYNAPATYDELSQITEEEKAEISKNHINSEGDNYPFRAVVKNSTGQLVHYGDWCTKVDLGILGVFYWELEEDGVNNGYKFSYVGTNDGVVVAESSLCTAHDDQGIITEYGYGFFVSKDQVDYISVETDSSVMDLPVHTAGNYKINEKASSALQEQLPDFTFYAFNVDGTSNGLMIKNTDANAQITIKYKDEYSYNFAINPFFGDSMQFIGPYNAASQRTDLGKFAYEPGTEDNKYSIRSGQQLQFINWNSYTKSVHTLVTDDPDIYMNYNYLYNCMGHDSHEASINTGSGSNKAVDFTKVQSRNSSFEQSHDLVGVEKGYMPIAGAYTSSTANSYENPIYAWFGGSYDGQSYVLKNINIDSQSFTVGLFGVTIGANMSNIVMYSDNNSEIKRSSQDLKVGSYVIGGLIGIAYDYTYKSGTTSNNVIKNCSIAGYNIVDNSTNQQGLGEANIGGLIGVSKISVENCSSVCTITISPQFNNGTAAAGIYIRGGGLVGAVQGSATNCYTGGEFIVPQSVQMATPAWSTSDHRFQIYLGGLSGSCFVACYNNITGENTSGTDYNSTFNNCYTYMQFPTDYMQNRSDYTIPSGRKVPTAYLGMSIFASIADRVATSGSSVTLNNCYYLDTIYNRPAGTKSTAGIHVTLLDRTTNNGIAGVTYEQMSLRDDSGSVLTNKIVCAGVSYDTFVKALNKNGDGPWTNVTIKENSASVDGKYSFPASDSALYGKNYPFATVLTQPDPNLQNATVNVHYGSWPKQGIYWNQARSVIDIFNDQDGSEGARASKTYEIKFAKSTEDPATASTINITADKAGVVEIGEVTYDSTKQAYVVTITALKTGAVNITATSTSGGTTYSDTATVNVTAAVRVYTNPEGYLDVPFNGTSTLQLQAISGKDVSKYAGSKWVFTNKGTDNIVSFDPVVIGTNVTSKVRPKSPGETEVEVKYVYTYCGVEYSASTNIFVTSMKKDTITFMPGSGATGETVSLEFQDSIDILPANGEMGINFTKIDGEGRTYQFIGWNTREDGLGTEYIAGEEVVLPGSKTSETLYAQWQPVYVVKFVDSEDPEKVLYTSYVFDGEYVNIPTSTPTKKEIMPTAIKTGVRYTFAGWYSDQTCKTEFNFAGTVITGDTTIFAKWNSADTYLVTFYMNEPGSTTQKVYKEVAVPSGYTVTKPGSPSTLGYSFTKWYTNIECTTAFSFGTIIKKNTQLYAGWGPKVETVTFNADGATNNYKPSVNATYNSIMPSITDNGYQIPFIPGYTFDGYYYGTDPSPYYDKNGTAVRKWNLIGSYDYVLKAHYKGNTYSVTFDGKGATNNYTKSTTVTYGSPMPSIDVLPDLNVPGFVFEGYYYDGVKYYNADGSSAEAWNHYEAESYTLTAKWRFTGTVSLVRVPIFDTLLSANTYSYYSNGIVVENTTEAPSGIPFIGRDYWLFYYISYDDTLKGTVSDAGKWYYKPSGHSEKVFEIRNDNCFKIHEGYFSVPDNVTITYRLNGVDVLSVTLSMPLQP